MIVTVPTPSSYHQPTTCHPLPAVNTDARLTELELRHTEQEDALRVLSDVVARQQNEISALRQACAQLAERLAQQPEGASRQSLQDEIPPHY